MRNTCFAVASLLGLLLLNGCGTVGSSYSGNDFAMPDEQNEPNMQRKRIWSATLTVDVEDLNDAAVQTANLVKKQGGFIETKSDYKDESVGMTLRVPSAVFQKTVAELGRIGSVSHQNIKAVDVTEQYVDMKERLKNMRLLRDKLQALLDKSTNVKDTLAIETELNRVQSDLDAMEAKMLQLTGRIQFSVIHLTFKREKILGPLGYLFKGLYWGFEKLFVIQR